MWYTLVGFSPELDWRPLNFVKPIPPSRVCAACGLVRKATVFLPCTHVLCECCYGQCADEGRHICPIDGYECQDEYVEMRQCPAEQILGQPVKCWNEEHGCKTTMSASEIFRHFHHECGRHSVSCPKCSSAVLCSEACSHLKSACQTKAMPLETGDDIPPCNHTNQATLTSLQFAVGKHADENKKCFGRIAVGAATHSDMISEVSHSIKFLKESLRDEMTVDKKQIGDLFTKSVRDITASNGEVKTVLTTLKDTMNNVSAGIQTLEKTRSDHINNESTRTNEHLSQVETAVKIEMRDNTHRAVEKIRQFLGHPQLQMAFSIFSVKGVKMLQQIALKDGEVKHSSEKVYLRGYCVSPGVLLRKTNEEVKLYALFCLHKGDMDEYLEWPFQHKISVSCVHPKTGSKRGFEFAGVHNFVYFRKPIEPQNTNSSFSGGCLDLENLFTDGYVEDDTLVVKWELLPRVEV